MRAECNFLLQRRGLERRSRSFENLDHEMTAGGSGEPSGESGRQQQGN